MTLSIAVYNRCAAINRTQVNSCLEFADIALRNQSRNTFGIFHTIRREPKSAADVFFVNSSVHRLFPLPYKIYI